jgi:autophagy-related protein 2
VDGGHETIKLLDSSKISWVENYFDNLPPQSFQDYSECVRSFLIDELLTSPRHGMRTFSLFAQNCHLSLKLYDGYDWQRTRDIIREHRKEIRRRLAKLRGVLAQGQTLNLEEEDLPGKLLFNSVYVGLDSDALDLEPAELIEAIDEELADYETETEMESSWQTIKPQVKFPKESTESNKLMRSSSPSVEIQLRGLKAEVESFESGQKYSSRTLVTAQELEIFDHMKTSTWARFLTGMKSGSGGNARETESNMLRVELLTVPTTSKGDDELRLRARLLPLRLHVDQDALDFFKAFFAFKYPDAPEPPSNASSGPFFRE